MQFLHFGSKESRASLRDTVSLPFTTLSPNTGVLTSLPFSTDMIHGSPDTIKVHGPSEFLTRDCTYSMHDRSSVRKPRVGPRRYIPYPHASSKDTGTFGFGLSSTPSSRAVTSNATSSKTVVNDSRFLSTWEVSKPSPKGYSTSHAEDMTLEGSGHTWSHHTRLELPSLRRSLLA